MSCDKPADDDDDKKAISTKSENKKRAIVSCVTDNFIMFGAVLLRSLVVSNSIPDNCNVIFLTNSSYAVLSQKNRDILRAIYSQVQFLEVDASFLSDDLVKRWHNRNVVKIQVDQRLPGKKSVYLKLHILRMLEYSSILWLDSDMMILRGIGGILRLPASLAMVRGGVSQHSFGTDYNKRGGFNSGLMLLNGDEISQANFKLALKLLEDRHYTIKQDQSLLNELWKNKDKLFIPHVYNWKVPANASLLFHKEAVENARVIHFVADSKWEITKTSKMPLHVAFNNLLMETDAPFLLTG